MKTKFHRKKFRKRKFLFSFVNIQNAIGATILFNNNSDERGAERVFYAQLRNQEKSPSDAENGVKTGLKPYKTANIITEYKTIKKTVFIRPEADPAAKLDPLQKK